MYSLSLVAVSSALAMLQSALSNADIWTVLDKYGFPTAMLTITVLFIWNRQKKADSDRNDLISRNNELTQQLINAVKAGNACKYLDIHGEK